MSHKGLAIVFLIVASATVRAEPKAPAEETVAFTALPGVAAADLAAAFTVFRASCAADASSVTPSRPAQPRPSGLEAACKAALKLAVVPSDPSSFFATHFSVRRVGSEGSAFFTGYYEPVVEGSLARTDAFPTPLYAKPVGVVAADGDGPARLRHADGTLSPMPDRAAIEAGALGSAARPLVYVRDAVEAFFVQVQGSARFKLPDGSLRRLVYAGRNGYPYTSIGKLLVQTLNIPPDQMGLTQLKAWIRAHGAGPDDAGTKLMQRNRSYIFFAFDDTLPASSGPIGGEGTALTPLRSLAVDRSQWPYGLPFYVDAILPWQSAVPTPFRRLMIGQDTGSAIVGPARADIFFGTGDAAAALAGPIRHTGTLYVLWPRTDPGVEGHP